MLSAKPVLDAVQALAAEEMLGYSLKIEGDEVSYGFKRVESEESKLSQSCRLWYNIFFQGFEKENKCVYFIVFLLADADKMYYTSVMKVLNYWRYKF